MKKFLFSLLIFTGCSSAPDTSQYPDRWWQNGTDDTKSWEVLPSAADRDNNEVIVSKRNELGILSNFAPTPFMYHEKRYASLEGFWQMMKYPEGPNDERIKAGIKWPHTREEVSAMTAFDAAHAGKEASEIMKKFKIQWITFEGEKIYYKTKPEGIERHYQLIYDATVAKLEQNQKVREVLLSTGDLKLLPDHHQDPDATKAYRYYEIYMGLRSKLRAQQGAF